jgi:hypothetical protein
VLRHFGREVGLGEMLPSLVSSHRQAAGGGLAASLPAPASSSRISALMRWQICAACLRRPQAVPD